jgi:hypothetical protein
MEAEQNGLMGATHYYRGLVIPYQPTNEMVSPDSFKL